MRETLVGTGTLVRLGLRRDRWLLPSWVLAFVFAAGFSASASAGLFPDEEARIEASSALNASAAMVAMFGRIYDPTSLGALSLIKLVAFQAAMVAVLMAVIVVRHTRAEEESGRLELASGGRLGRNAPLTAALIIVAGACASLGVLTSLALVVAGLPATGSFAFGLGWGATGMAFAAFAAVAAQLTTSARAATGLSVSAIAGAFLLRGIGDLSEPGPSVFSWVSPIGWNQQIRAFAGDRLWVLCLPLALTAVLVLVAFLLRARRDLGGGMRPDRVGPPRGELSGVWDLAVHLHHRVLIAWAVAVVVFGFLVGSLIDTVADFLSSSDFRDILEKLGGTQVLEDAFLAAELGLVGIMISAYGIAAASRLRSEETSGYVDALLGTATTRLRWVASHSAAALGGVALLLILLGLAVGTGAAISMGEASQVGRVVLAATAQVPAAWVLVGLTIVAFGWVPRLSGVVWGLFFAFVMLGEFGILWGVPQWVMNLSPYQHSPGLPVGSDDVVVLVVLTVVAAALAALGFLGWRRRDLAP